MSEVSDPIFAKIAARYDRLNSILSLGQEKRWRASGITRLDQGMTLDLGCGTGSTDFSGRDVVGLDPVVEMIALSPSKMRVVAVGEALPFVADSFAGVFSGFVFRNLTSVETTLEEVGRVLKPGGRLVVVDLGRPRKRLLRPLHRMGTALLLPLVGLLFAGAPLEYWYLHRSLDSLPPPEVMFDDCGFVVEDVWRMGLFGFVYGASLLKPQL